MAKKRNRAHYTKSTAGCQTCKIRRVKCDLNQPHCQRCESTGRACDGPRSAQAFVFRHERPAKRVKSPIALDIPAKPRDLLFLNHASETRAFDFFLRRAAPLLAGALDEGLWDRLVPRLAQSDEAVKYAAFAISHFFEHPMRRDNNGQICLLPASPEHLLGLTWHEKALSADRVLRSKLTRPEILVKIILFASLEFQQNNLRGGLYLIRLAYKVVAPLLTAGCEASSNTASPDDEIIRVVLPMFMRSVCLLFTSGDNIGTTLITQSLGNDLQLLVFRSLCITYASLKDQYLAIRSNTKSAFLKLRYKQDELRHSLRILKQHALSAYTSSRVDDQNRSRFLALRDYCDISLGWLKVLEDFPDSECATFLIRVLEHLNGTKSNAQKSYFAAAETMFFEQMAIIPPAYLVAVFATDLAIRNQALEAMHYSVVRQPNTQLHAIVMSFDGDVVNTSDLEPYQHASTHSPNRRQLEEEDEFFEVGRLFANTFAEKSQTVLYVSDMNKVYPAKCEFI